MQRVLIIGGLFLCAVLGLLVLPAQSAGPAPPKGPAPLGSPSPGPTACPIYFIDVPGSHPFYGPILCLACRGVLSGYADATFRPAASITRGQTAKLVANSAGFNDPIPANRQTFADVPANHTFWLFVERNALHGTISGYQCGGPGEPCDGQNRPYFRPAANVTRGQLAKIVVGAAGFADPVPTTQQTFADVPGSQPFWLFVERAALHAVISGYACGGPGEPCDAQNRPYFRPGNTATRGQTSKIVAQTFFPGCLVPPAAPLLRLASSQEPDTLLPYVSNLYVSQNLQAQIFNGLVRRDEADQVLPDLALTVPTFDNGGAIYVGTGDNRRLVVTYRLRPGVRWADDIELTAADVVFTFNLVRNVEFQVDEDRQGFLKYAGVSAPDPYTVVFNYLTWPEAAALIAQDPQTYGFLQPYVDAQTPVTDVRYNENFGYILPAHALAAIPPGQIVNSAFARQAWGTGPYYVSEWSPGIFIQLEANPYYNVTPNTPRVPRLHSSIIYDINLLLARFAAGEFDVTDASCFSISALPQLRNLEQQGVLVVLSRTGRTWEHLDFHTQRAPFDDVRLRQAVAYAIDRPLINQQVFFGGVTLQQSWPQPFHWTSIENPVNAVLYPQIVSQFRRYTYNPAQANALLDQAGWIVGPGGYRVKNGRTLSIRLQTTAANQTRARITQIIKENLRAVGFDVVLEYVPAQRFFADDGPIYTGSYGDFGMAEFGWVNEFEPGGSIYDSSQIPNPPNNFFGLNVLWWSNPQNDQLLRAAATYLGRDPERARLLLQQQVLFSQEVPSIPLYTRPYLAVYRPGVRNVQMLPDGIMPNVYEWELPP